MNKKVAAKPGLHFQAIPCPRNSYFLFPEEPQRIFSTYRHAWALRRKARPDVVLIEKCKLPHPSKPNDYIGQYYNLFFRPWTLLPGEVTVPNLTLLGLNKADRICIYDGQSPPRSKMAKKNQKNDDIVTVADKVNWMNTWSEDVQGNIVSNSAALLIQSFLLNTWTTSSSRDDDDESEAGASEEETELPALKLSSQKLADLLRPSGTATTVDQDENRNAQTTAKKKLKASLSRRKPHLQEYIKSQQIGETVWKTPMTNTAAEDRQNPGHLYEDTYGDHLAALKNIQKIFLHATTRWLASYAGHPTQKGILVKPNTKQKEFLYHFLNRLKLEVLELQQHIVNAAPEEPLLDLIHGFPGTGKSELIKWMRQLMEKRIRMGTRSSICMPGLSKRHSCSNERIHDTSLEWNTCKK